MRLDEMGFIFQQMYMMKNLTILDNILLPAMESKKDERSRAEKVAFAEELMRKLSIIEVADNDINEVSGGQLQRACICRSMVNHPKLLFADEPTGALNRAASKGNTKPRTMRIYRRQTANAGNRAGCWIWGGRVRRADIIRYLLFYLTRDIKINILRNGIYLTHDK